MTLPTLTYRWSRDEFLRAYEAGAFDNRVELVDGEVWPVVLGSWHGQMIFRVSDALPRTDADITAASLPAGDSLPDPDCWVKRADAQPVSTIGARVDAWSADDVLLVIEVSDETVMHDLNVKARVYGAAGFPVYWVVTRDVIYEHTEPTQQGYRVRIEYRAGDRIPVRYADTDLAVADILDS